LLGSWKDGCAITEDLVKAGKAWEERLTNLFLKAIDLQRNSKSQSAPPESAEKLRNLLREAEAAVHAALSDSFSTPIAMQTMASLVSDVHSIPYTELDVEATLDIALWLTKMVTILGLNGEASLKDVSTIGWADVQIPASAKPIVYRLSSIRDSVRTQARSGSEIELSSEELAPEPTSPAGGEKYAALAAQFVKEITAAKERNAPAKDFLSLCDELRDTHLWNLDIYLEDRDGLPALVRPLDQSLKAARAEKEALQKQKAEAKAKREAEEAEKLRKKMEAASIDPKTMFKTDEYSEWDENGVPTKDKEGKELAKARKKKLMKEWERQNKLFTGGS